MHVLVLGATSSTGISLVRETLDSGHTVTIYARSPRKLPEPFSSNPSITIIQGQLTDVDSINKAMVGVDAVLSVLGPPSASGFSYTLDTPIARAYTLIIDAMKQHHVKRLIALSTASFEDGQDRFSLSYALLVGIVRLFAKGAYKEVRAIGEIIRSQGKDEDLEWTIVRVPFLTDSIRKDAIAGYVGDGRITVTLSRIGFAAWVVRELEEGQWKWKVPQLSDPSTDYRAMFSF